MVKKADKERKTYFICEACGFAYKDMKIAKECEDYCNKHHSCPLEITKNAVKLEE